MDASLVSVNFTRAGGETALQDENTASADLLKGHLIGDAKMIDTLFASVETPPP